MKTFLQNVVFFFIAFALYAPSAEGQVLITYPANAESISVCEGDWDLSIRVQVTEAGGIDDSMLVSIAFPPAIEYVPGLSISSITPGFAFTEFDISDLNNPEFVLVNSLGTTIPTGSFVDFVISREATACDYYLNSQPLKDEVSVFTSAGDLVENDPTRNTYQSFFASLQIPVIPVLDMVVGSNQRTFTVQNGGFSCLSEFELVIDYPTEISPVSLSIVGGGMLTPSSSVGNSVTYLVNSALIPGGCLDNNESMMFEEVVEIASCSFTSANGNYQARWGCGGEVCQTNMQNGSFTFDNGVFNLTTRQEFDDQQDRCGVSRVRRLVINDGTDSGTPGSQAYLDLMAYLRLNLTTPYTYSNFVVGDQSLTPVIVSASDVEYQFDLTDTPLSIEGLSDVDGDGFADDLAVNDTLIIEYDVMRGCLAGCPATYALDRFTGGIRYLLLCDQFIGSTTRTTREERVTGERIAGSYNESNSFSLPTTVADGMAENIGITHQRTYYDRHFTACPDPSINLTMELSTDFDVVGNEISVNGTTFPISRSGTTITLNAASIGAFSESVVIDINIPFQVSDAFCMANGDGAMTSTGPMPYTIEYTCETGGGCCTEEWACETLASVPGICDPSCSPTVLTLSPSVERMTFGFAPNAIDPVDVSSLPEESLQKVIHGDTVRHTDSLMIGDDDITTWVQAIILDSIGDQSPVELLDGLSTISYDGPSGMSTCMIPASAYSIVGIPGGTVEYRLDLPTIVSLGCLPGGLSFLETGSSFVITTDFRMNDLPIDGVNINAGLNQIDFKVENRVETRLGISDVCGRRSRVLYYAYEVILDYFRTRLSGAVCDTIPYLAEYYIHVSGGRVNQFPGEIRPLVFVDSLTTRLDNADAFWIDALLTASSYLVDGSNQTAVDTAFTTVNDQEQIFINNRDIWPLSGDLGIPSGAPAGATRFFYLRKYFGVACNFGVGQVASSFDLRYRTFDTDSVRVLSDGGAVTINSDSRDPVRQGSGAVTVVDGAEPIEHWIVRYQASGNRRHGPRTWIYIDTTVSTGVSIQDVYRVDPVTSARIADNDGTLAYTDGYYARLKDTLGEDRYYGIDFSYSGCEPDTVMMIFAKACNEYPADPGGFACYRDTQMLIVNPVPAEIQGVLLSQPNSQVDLCEDLTYEIIINSAQEGNVLNPLLTFELPDGIEIISGSLQAQYPNNSSFEPLVGSGPPEMLSLHLNQLLNLDSLRGLPGSSSTNLLDERQIRIQFQVRTDCDFMIGENFSYSLFGEQVCGLRAIGDNQKYFTSEVRINDTPDNDYILLDSRVDDLTDCAIAARAEFSLVTVGSSPSIGTDTFYIELPTGVLYESASYQCMPATGTNAMSCPSFVEVQEVAGRQVIILAENMPTPSGSAYSISFGFEADESSIMCVSSENLSLNITRTLDMLRCDTEDTGFCMGVIENEISEEFSLTVTLPTLSLDTLITSIDEGTLTASGNVINNSTEDLGPLNEIYLEFYCVDQDTNIVSSLIATETLAGGLSSGGSLPFSVTITDPCVGTNQVLARLIRGDGDLGMENCSCESDSVVSALLPSITCPPIETVICSLDEEPIFANAQSFVDSGAIVTGFCEPLGDLSIALIDSSESLEECNRLFTRTYRISDGCGGVDSCAQSILFINSSVPRFFNADDTIMVDCNSDLPPLPDSIFIGGCSDVEIRSSIMIVDSLNPSTFTRLVEYVLTDGCNNTDTLNQVTIVADMIVPQFQNCPPDTIAVSSGLCGGDVEVTWPIPVAMDECSLDTVEQTSGPDYGSVLVTGDYDICYTATDEAGNTSMCCFVVSVKPGGTDVPILACQKDMEMGANGEDCDYTTAEGELDPVLAQNSCGGIRLDHRITLADGTVGTLDTGEVAAGTVLQLGDNEICYFISDSITLEVLDSCCFIVTIVDDEAPVLTCPTDITVECDGSGNTSALAAFLMTTATDNCDEEVSVTSVLFNTISACGGGSTETYEFTATDASGNSSTCLASFTIEDTGAPMITTPASGIEVVCDGDNNITDLLNWLNSNGGAVATDACGSELSWSNDYGSVDMGQCQGTGSITVTFTATDACGLSATTTATLTINDAVAPSWTVVPTSLTLECTADADPRDAIAAWVAAAGNGIASDDCSVVTYSHDFVALTPSCEGGTSTAGTAMVVFTAMDACGNATPAPAVTLTIEDTTSPELLSPAKDTLVECDGAGNAAELASWLGNNGGAVASDLCGSVTWNTPVLMNTIEGCGSSVELVYMFAATDACGNVSANTIASFVTEDTTSPVIGTQAMDESVSCDGAGNGMSLSDWLANNGGAVGTDDCSGPVVWSYDLVQESDLCDLTGTGLYRFTATDDCGNTSTTEATFEITDIVAPTLTAVATDITVVCDGDNNITELLNWLNSNGGATATDNCNEVTWSNDYGQVDGGACAGEGSIEVTFTATDACGNSTPTTATLTISDEVAPVWTIAPTNLTLECTDDVDPMDAIMVWLAAAGNGSASDDCSAVVYSNDFLANGGLTPACGAGNTSGSATVTFTATDACGNPVTAMATVTIEDTTPPAVTSPAVDMTVECDGAGNAAELAAWLMNQGGATFSDICGEVVVNTPVLINTIPGCGLSQELVYGFSNDDLCGNTSAQTIASFIIEDTSPPIVNPEAMDMTVECDGFGNDADLDAWLANMASSAATDICSDEPLQVEFDLIQEEDSCGITGIQVYRFTFTDNCGNSSTTEGMFTIEDTAAPVITGGENASGECDQSNANNDDELLSWLNNRGGATAEDVCGTVVWSNDYDVANFVDGCNDSRNIDVTFTATDDCGNASSITLNFSTGDNTPPVFTNCPRPAIVVDAPEGWCEAFVNFSQPLAVDNCGIPDVAQTDTTGLMTGDLFPVGLTILEFTATDSCGNETLCELKIVVNDYHVPPMITCPDSVTVVNDPMICGAVVNDLTPTVVDNCPDNTAVTYEVFDSLGGLITSGIEDASGVEYPVGENTVVYTVFDQPILLVTEVIQDGTTSGIEIGNIGPATMDISCASLTRITATDTVVFIVPNGTVIGVGEVYTHDFVEPIVTDEETTYQLGFIGTVLDEVTINDGILDGENVYRIDAQDSDDETDWAIANDCQPGSYGMYNPELPVYTDNGGMSSLQSEPASSESCSFTVTVVDIEAPVCATQDTMSYVNTGIAILDGVCITSVQTVGAGTVGEVRVTDFLATVTDAGAINAILTSPEGTTIKLFGGLCEGTAGIDLSLDDKAATSVTTAGCTPLGNGGVFQPEEAFKAFYGEEAAGDWTLSIYADGPVSGTLDTWTLDVLTNEDYAQMDTLLYNDTLVCQAEFTWIHPVFTDNCCEGSMTVTYTFSNDTTGVMTEVTETVLTESGFIDLDGTEVTRVFEVGTTVVTYTLTDLAGNEGFCGFEVVVVDDEKPMFPNGCADITIDLGPGECYGSLGSLYLVTDNCGVDSIYYVIDGETVDADSIPIGINMLTQIAIDIYGNIDSCEYTVTVNEHIPEDGTLVCIDRLNVSLGPDCMAMLDPEMLLSGTDYGCYEDFCIVVVDANGKPHDNKFDITDAGQTFDVSVVDCMGGGNSCWGQVTIEHKLIPDFECPRDTIISCNENISPSILGEPLVLSCVPGDVKITYEDIVSFEDCETGIAAVITRVWTMTYQGGTSTCEQKITVEAFDVMEVDFPADFFGEDALSCSAVSADPTLTTPAHTGQPNVNGQSLFGESFCEINVGYWDETLQDVNCEGGYELLRHWIVRDECAPLVEGVNPLKHIQSIKVEDFTAPVIKNIGDITISTDLWGCGAVYSLDSIEVSDNCASREDIEVKVSVQGGAIHENSIILYGPAKNRTFTVTVKATDKCKNTSFETFTITALDKVPPVVVADAHDVVSLGRDGVAKILAENFDDGSHDGCSPVGFRVKRVDDGPDCAYDEFLPAGNDNAQLNEAVFFCCSDIKFDENNEAIPVMVIFEVCDDADGNNVFGSAGDYCNTAMVEVTVQEKLPPLCSAPADMTVNCLDVAIYTDLLNAGILSDGDVERANAAFGEANVGATCNAEYTQSFTSKDQCNGKGEITRILTAKNTINGLTTTCTQRIYILTDTTNVLSCDDISFPADSEESKAGYDWCETNSKYIGGVEDLEGEDFPAIMIDNCDGAFITPPSINIDQLCSEVGIELSVDTFQFAGGGCKKILAHWEIIDQCQFKENYLYFNGTDYEINPFVPENGYYELYVEYDVFDTVAPVITCGSDQIVECGQQLLGPITATAVDACTSDEFLGWTWNLDVNNDGSIDHTGNGNRISPSDIGLTEFPASIHSVTWIVNDGCGNNTSETCVFGFSKDDTKAPTPYCYDGLSSSVMLMNGVTLWASDFDAGSTDNCSSVVVASMVPESDVAGLSDTAAYEASKKLVMNPATQKMEYGWAFDCSYIPNGVSATLDVRVYVTDESGNWDYCVASFRIQDNLGACEDVEGGLALIGGNISTEMGESIQGVAVDMMTTNPEFPKFATSDEDGSYVFYSNPSSYNYEIGAEMDEDYLNGVTTLDLVLIQKHMLGLKILDSPYKYIAADINGDESIKVSDLLQLRKLILGIYANNDLPNNESWRFVDKDYNFTNSASPWPFNEIATVENLETNMMSEDFVGVKIGDVNSSVVANKQMLTATRSASKFNLSIDEKNLEAGSVYEVQFNADESHQITGYQFTVGFDTEMLEYVGQKSAQVLTSDANYGLQRVSEGLISTSWHNGSALDVEQGGHMFSLLFKVKKTGKLSDALALNSEITRSEAYVGEDLSIHEVGLEVRGAEDEVKRFELRQNSPNPYNRQTVIEYVLPESHSVTFTIANTVGQQVYVKTLDGISGPNTLSLDRTDINTPGVYYYTLKSGDYTATRKMIVVK